MIKDCENELLKKIINLFELGSFNEIEKIINNRIANNRELIYLLSIYNIYSGKYCRSEIFLEKLISINDPTKYRALLSLSILFYIKSNIKECNRCLELIENINENLKENSFRAYGNLMLSLLNWRMNNPGFKMYYSPESPKLYIIGDSHSLSGNGVIFNIQGNNFLGETKLIMGIQMHHLASNNTNKYKSSIIELIKCIPKGSSILISIGEIDTRFEYGFIKHSGAEYKKLNEKIKFIVVQYLLFLNQFSNSLNLIISGIAVPSRKSMKKDEMLNLVRNYVIKKTNCLLKEHSVKSNFGYLDLYQLTSQMSDQDLSLYRLDSFHLSPKAYSDAFYNQLINSP